MSPTKDVRVVLGDGPEPPVPTPAGILSAKTITYATVILTSTTILVCYVIAVSLHHEHAWLPMISDCATKSPEMFIFRYGMLVAAALLGCNVVIIHAATKSTYSLSSATLTSGLLAAFGLGLLTAVNVHEKTSVHGAAAVAFFVCYEVFMLIISYNAHFDARVSRTSLNVKRIAATISLVSLLCLAGMSIQWKHFHRPIAVCEWTSTIMIQIFNLSFVKDLGTTVIQEIAGITTGSYVPLKNVL